MADALTIDQILTALDQTKGKGYTLAKIQEEFTRFLDSLRGFSSQTEESTIRDLLMDRTLQEKFSAEYSETQKDLKAAFNDYVRLFRARMSTFSLWHLLGLDRTTVDKTTKSLDDFTSDQIQFGANLKAAAAGLLAWVNALPSIRIPELTTPSLNEERDVFNEDAGVQVTGFSRQAILSIRDILGPITAQPDPIAVLPFEGPTAQNPSGPGLFDVLGSLAGGMGLGSLAGWLGKTIFGAGGLAIGAGIAGLFTDGPFKEIIKIGARIFGTFGKKIPGLGLLLGIGYGISRIQEGDIKGGILEIASGLSSTLPVAGTALSFGIDAFLAWRDLSTGGSGAIGRGESPDPLDAIIQYVQESALAKRFINIGDGFQKLLSGDVIGGIKDIAYNGFFAFVPLASAIDFLGSDQGKVATSYALARGGDMMAEFGQWFAGTEIGRRMIGVGTGALLVMRGDVKHGIGMMSEHIAQLAPVRWLMDKLDVSPAMVQNITANTGNLLQNVYNALEDTPVFRELFKISTGVSDIIMGDYAKGFRAFADNIPSMGWLNLIVDMYDTSIPESTRAESKDSFVAALKTFKSNLTRMFYNLIPPFIQPFFELGPDGTLNIKSPEQFLESMAPQGSFRRTLVDSGANLANNAVDTVKTEAQSFLNIAADYFKSTWFKEGYVPKKHDDVIWRPNQAPIGIHRDDTILAAKKDGPVDRLLAGPQSAPDIDWSNLKTTILDAQEKFAEHLADMISAQTAVMGQMAGSIANLGSGGGSSGGDVEPARKEPIVNLGTGQRDPAWLHRIRAWEYISPGVRMA